MVGTEVGGKGFARTMQALCQDFAGILQALAAAKDDPA
jgi:hypothetical protein